MYAHKWELNSKKLITQFRLRNAQLSLSPPANVFQLKRSFSACVAHASVKESTNLLSDLGTKQL